MDSGKCIRRITVLLLVLTANLQVTALAVDPELSITRTQNTVVVSWPLSAGDLVLEAARYLESPIPWSPISATLYRSNAAERYVEVPIADGGRFYRLRRLLPMPGRSGSWRLDAAVGAEATDESASAGAVSFSNTTWVVGNGLESGPRAGAGALHFNGGAANGNGSRAWVSNENFRVLPPAGQPFSISLWFSADALTSGWRGLAGNNVSGSNGWAVALHTPSPGTNYLIFSARGSPNSLSVTGRSLLLPRQWYHLTATYDGSEGRLYLDGALLARSSGTLTMHEGPIYFGGGVGGYDSFLGRIDELRTYTNCLTEEQIALAGHWRLDEEEGTVAFDSSVNEHHGFLSTTTAWTAGKSGSGIDASRTQVAIANSDFTLLPQTGRPFSISFWLKPQVLPLGRSGLMSCSEGTNEGWELTLEVAAPEQVLVSFASIDNGGTLNLHAPISLATNAWTRLDVTYNGGIATIYANGRKLGSDNGAIRASNGPLLIGTARGAAAFDGVIDELKIYCYERDASDIGPIAPVMWETVLLGYATNITLQGSGPVGKTLTYALVDTVRPTNGTVSFSGTGLVTYQAGGRKGPDAFAYTVSDGEFTSEPALVCMSVVQPHWLTPNGGTLQPRDGSGPERAWAAGAAEELDAIWKTNNYYDCFFYAPGVYETTGWKFLERSTANAGCKHIGSGSAGPNETTVKLVNTWEAWNEGMIFSMNYFDAYDGFEVHNMVLDCNAQNNPKYVRGEPTWIRIPLSEAASVETLTLRWHDRWELAQPAMYWHYGRAAEFTVLSRVPASNSYITNCHPCTSTGLVDVIAIGVTTDEIMVQFEALAPTVDVYSLAEAEVTGANISLPQATIPSAGQSRLHPESATYSILKAVDADTGTSWASGDEAQVEIVLPLQSNTTVSQITFNWNCRTLPDGRRLGPASNYVIRARDPNTRTFFNVPFLPNARSADGLQVITLGTAQGGTPIVTDQMVVLLTEREAGVNSYSLREVSLRNSSAPINLRVPMARTAFSWGINYSVVNAFDGAQDTFWRGGTRGMIGAVGVSGSNIKLINLKVIGFGTTPTVECFPMYVVSRFPPPAAQGNVLVEDCVITDPAPNNKDGLTALTVFGYRGSLTNAVVRRCAVRGLRSHFTYSHALNGNRFENCVVEDCGNGVYFEPYAATDNVGAVLIRSNQFINVQHGFYMYIHPGMQFGSINFLENEIVLAQHGGWAFHACDVCAAGPSGSISNLTFMNNVVRYADWLPRPGPAGNGLFYSDIRHGVIGNNIIALGTANSLRVRQCPAGLIVPPDMSNCDQPPVTPPPPDHPACLDALPAGYRRAWFNNRDLSGDLFDVRFSTSGVDGLATQQQWR